MPYNTSPVYFGQNPTRDNTSTYQYAWTGWTIEGDPTGTVYDKFCVLPKVTSDITFVANIDGERWKYTVSFRRKDGTPIEDQLLERGATPVCSFNPPTMPPSVDKLYTFTNWEGYAAGEQLPKVSRPVTYYALFSERPRPYTIVFYRYDAITVLTATSINYGSPAYYPAMLPNREDDDSFSYDFCGWKASDGTFYPVGSSLPVVTGETFYIAQYTQVPKRYKITFCADNGELDETADWSYGTMPSYSKGEPEKLSTAEWQYTFSHWQPAVTEVTQDAVYKAVYDSVKRSYIVRFLDHEGNDLVEPQSVEYGLLPVVPDNPTKPSDGSNMYEFIGWTPDVVAVTEDIVYTPLFRASELSLGYHLDIIDWNEYLITVNMNGYVASGSGTEKSAWTVYLPRLGAEYTKADLDDKNLLTIDVSDIEPEPDDDIVIVAKNINGETDSYRRYIVPYIINTDATASDDLTDAAEQSVIFVRSGSLVVDVDLTVDKIYVAPGAELIVNNGVTLVAEQIVLRTKAHAVPAMLTDNGTIECNHFYYSRISTDNSRAYQIGFPYDVDFRHVVVSNECLTLRYADAGIRFFGTLFGMLRFDSERRASEGFGGNWIGLDTATDWTMNGGEGYQILAASSFYYEFYFPVEYSRKPADAEIELNYYVSSADNAADNGWNYIVTPFTDTYYINNTDVSPEDRLKIIELTYNPRTGSESFRQYVPDELKPASPFYFQASSSGVLSLMQSSVSFISDSASAGISHLPSKITTTKTQTQWVDLRLQTADQQDITTIFLHPSKFSDHYDIGYDMAKIKSTPFDLSLSVALPYGDMAFAALPDSVAEQALLPLNVNMPAEGDITFSLEYNNFMSRLLSLMLIDMQAGTTTDIIYNDYMCSADSTIADRFYLKPIFRKSDVVTSDDSEKSEPLITVTNREVVVTQLPTDRFVYCYDIVGKLVAAQRSLGGKVSFVVPQQGIYLIRTATNLHKITVY